MVLRLHSISRWCYLHKIPFAPRLIQAFLHVFFKCVLPPECSIGSGTALHHHGWCTAIDTNVEIGRACDIYNLVQIGDHDNEQTGLPARIIIGDRVSIQPGARVLCKSGTLTVGEQCTIGANSVVESDVPAHSIVMGVPARITRKES